MKLKLTRGQTTNLQLPIITIGAAKDNEINFFEIIIYVRKQSRKHRSCSFGEDFSSVIITHCGKMKMLASPGQDGLNTFYLHKADKTQRKSCRGVGEIQRLHIYCATV